MIVPITIPISAGNQKNLFKKYKRAIKRVSPFEKGGEFVEVD